MNRKSVYGLLLVPILIFGIMAIAVPTFRTEFVHNVRSMLGFPPPEYGDGSKGLRSEHPDEYGGAYASPDEAEEGSVEEETGEASEADTGEASDADADTTPAESTEVETATPESVGEPTN